MTSINKIYTSAPIPQKSCVRWTLEFFRQCPGRAQQKMLAVVLAQGKTYLYCSPDGRSHNAFRNRALRIHQQRGLENVDLCFIVSGSHLWSYRRDWNVARFERTRKWRPAGPFQYDADRLDLVLRDIADASNSFERLLRKENGIQMEG